MRGRDGKGPQATDLLVCFPTRAHLSLMPKPICSPARPSDSSPHNRHHHHRRPSQHFMRKSNNRGGATGSPLLWVKTKNHSNNVNNNADMSEPTSPKVTCAGQIKVRSTKPNSCKNWQSVMEEIERLHNSRKKQNKRPAWIEAFGFKKDAMQFLTCLRNIRFDFRCFGSIPAAEITSDEEEDEDDEDLNGEENAGDDEGSSGAVFSKWFMILQEENNLGKEMNVRGEDQSSKRKVVMPRFDDDDDDYDDGDASCAPPPNALLLMRCRSAPAKTWLEEREEEEERERIEECDRGGIINGKELIEEESKGTDFCEFAVEIAEENRIQEKFSRSRSWKR